MSHSSLQMMEAPQDGTESLVDVVSEEFLGKLGTRESCKSTWLAVSIVRALDGDHVSASTRSRAAEVS
jgi:hypothetical protein